MTKLTRAMNRYIKDLATIIAVALFAWLLFSVVVFKLRHPWMTETETFLNIPNAMLLRKIPYDEMRR